MDLLSLALSLSLPFGRDGFSGDYSLDVNPTFAIPAPTGRWGASATTIPGAVLYDPEYERYGGRWSLFDNPDFMRHELTHAEQQAALGPGFWAAYAGTGGRAFEPYDPLARLIPGAEVDGHDHNMAATWRPEDEQRNAFPLFRLARSGDATRAQFLPGYPQLVNEDVRW